MRERSLLLVALGVALAFALALMPASAHATEKAGVVYTALGDSIGAGYGGTDGIGYTDLLKNHLAQTCGSVTFYDLCENGLSSGDLKWRLMSAESPYRIAYGAAVANADIITISIGGNDLLQPLGQFATAHPEILAPGYLESLTPEQLQALFAPLFAQLDGQSVIDFGNNLAITTAYIRTLNPDAEIHVNTLYTPLRPNHVLYGFVDAYIRALNAVITGCSVSPSTGDRLYEVVDVYVEFAEYGNPSKLLVFDLANLQFAPHPTDRGYKLIYNLHKNALGAQ